MRTHFLWGLYILTLGMTDNLSGQQETHDPCLHRLEVASAYLTAYEYPSEALLEQALASVENCLILGNGDALYIQGVLLLKKDSNIQQKKEAFALIKNAALQDHANAMSLLGDLYKDGIGIALDFDLAMEWYQKAADLGNQKAAFKIGYIYLKGLGTVEQDYTKAVQWFASSKYPMAKHWLAICQYKGYGTTQNTSLAIEQLKTNNIPNSSYLVKQWENEIQASNTESTSGNTLNNEALGTTEFTDQHAINNATSADITNLSDDYVGRWVEYDWSGKHIVRTIPITMELHYDGYQDELTYTIAMNDKNIQGSATRLDNAIYFEGVSFPIERLYKDNLDEMTLNYDLQSISFNQQRLNDVDYLIGAVDCFINEWQEPGPPIQIILKKSSWDLSDEALSAFSAQDSFIKLYPNPFHSDVLVQYELEQPAQVSASIVSISNVGQQKVIESGAYQSQGKQLYRIDGSDLPNGMYVIRIHVDGTQHTKLVVKQ